MRKKKVLFLTFWYPDENNPIKGVFILEHARALLQAGYDVRLVAFNIRYSKKILYVSNLSFTDEGGLPTHLLKIHSVFHKLIYVAVPLLSRIVFRYYLRYISPYFQPDIIHSNVLYPAAIAGHYLARRIGKPHVITEHWSKVDKFFQKNLFSCSGSKAYREAHAITAVSGWLKKNIEKRVSDPKRIFVVPNVVSPVFSYSQPRTVDEIVFSVVAKWEPPKNIDLIIEALQLVASGTSRPIVLQIVGEGSLLGPVLEKRSRFLFAINHLGYQSKTQIAGTFRQTDFFLHCSMMETFSIVIAEALCAGVPVVASKVGAIPEIINPDNGILCNNTATDWAEAIREALQTPYDRMQISRQAISLYSAEPVSQLFGDVYDSVLQGHQN